MKKLPTPHEQSWPVKKETSDYVRQQQEEAASKVDEDFYRIIVETIREPVFVHRVFENGETGMFERVNTAACLMTGYAETELLRMRPVDLYEKEDLKHYSMAEYPDYEGRHNECLFESIIRHKSGKRIVTETSVNKVIFGSTPYFISTVHEITLRKEAYRDLAESNSRLQLIMDAAHAGIWEWNIQTNANIWTDELWRLYGLEPHSGEASYDLWLQSIALEDREKTEQIIIQSSKKGMEFTAEWRVHTEDGSERWLMSKGTPFRDRNGKVNRYVGIVLDVTRLKLAQKAEITEQSFRKAIIESIPGTFYMLDSEGRYAGWNAYQRDEIIGQPEHEMFKTNAIESIHPEDRSLTQEKITNVLQNGTVEITEGRVLLRGGPAFRWFLMTGRRFVFDGHPYLIGTGIDITDRKRIEDVQTFLARTSSSVTSRPFFKVLSRYLAACFDMNFVCIGQLDNDGAGTTTLSAWCDDHYDDAIACILKDTPSEQIQGKEICIHQSGVRELFPQDPLLRMLQAESYIATTLFDHQGSPIGIIKVIGRRPLENPSMAETIMKLVAMRSSGELERLKTEKSLLKSEKKYRELFESVPIGLYQSDMEGNIITANQSCIDMSHCGNEDRDAWFSQDTRASYVDAKDSERFRSLLSEHGYVSGFEARFRRYDGSIAWLSNTAKIVHNESRKDDFISGSFIDITDRKQAEEEKAKLEAQLQQSQKMELVGRLAGGIAHDFNNMLGVILGNAELALIAEPRDKTLKNNLEEIVNAANRSANLTRQLLAFARKQAVNPKVIDLNLLIEGMLSMLRRVLGEDKNLIWHPDRSQPRVNIDPSQIDQILVNLCVNARDAITDIGTVTISTAIVCSISIDCADSAEKMHEEYVMLTVTDTGHGIEQEHHAHIFEPFFTTKEIGKGTGLGLATVYGIVKQNEGFITFQSEPEKGCSFRIYLPRYHTIDSHSEDEKTDSKIMIGKETVLIVEDEPEILKLCRMALEKIGYSVLTAAKPDEAIRIAGDRTIMIHLLLTDVIMPEMNGRDLADKLRSIIPDLKVLYMSGYTADNIACHGVLETGVNFIQKPFTIKALSKKVCNVLAL
jgi:two-component system cell cycle sensor histidine kinase/response regulator CckA